MIGMIGYDWLWGYGMLWMVMDVLDCYGTSWMVMAFWDIYIYILGYIRHIGLHWCIVCVCHSNACDAAFRSGGADCETNTVPSGGHAPIFVLPVVFLPCGTLGVTFLARRHHLPCARSRAPCTCLSLVFSCFIVFHQFSSCFHKW